MTQVCISGVGAYVPTERRTNQHLAAELGVTEDISSSLGIRERVLRHWMMPVRLAFRAASRLEHANTAPEDIDGIRLPPPRPITSPLWANLVSIAWACGKCRLTTSMPGVRARCTH